MPPRPRPHLKLVRPAGDVDATAQWVAAACVGDQRAQEQLYDAHVRYVRQIARRILGPDGELADVLQEVFARVFRDLRQLEDPARLRPWIATITVHVTQNYLRARRRRRWLRFFAPAEVPEVEDRSREQDGLVSVRRAYAVLEQLPDDERVAFVLRFVEGMPLDEVSALTGSSLATVKRRLARARAFFVERSALDVFGEDGA